MSTSPTTTPQHELAREVLGVVARAGFASVHSLLAHAGPAGLTAEILDRWCETKLLHRGRVPADPVSGTHLAYVALAPAGGRLLTQLAGRAVQAVSSARMRRSSQKRLHDIGVGDFALAVLALGRMGIIDLAGIETDDRKLATSTTIVRPGAAPERVPLQADAFVVTKDARGPVGLLAEVDRATTSIARMTKKYAAYLAWMQEGGPERDFGLRALRVVTIAPDEKRIAKLHDAALRANDDRRSGFLLFAPASDVTPADPERLLTPIARPLGSDASTLVPLFESRGTSRPPGPRNDRDLSRDLRIKSSPTAWGSRRLAPHRSLAGAASSQAPLL